jgi:succinate dehydrogenase / fumarate reductase flavoprotein subunit
VAQIEEAQAADAAAEMTRYLSGPGDEDPYRLHAELQATMNDDVGIFRDEAGLTAAVARLDELERRAADARSPSTTTAYNPGWHLCRDVRNMLVVSQAVARAALLRRESRGAHSRLDCPAYDDYWGEHNIVVRRDADGVRVEPRPVVKTAELAALIEERKEAERA